MASFATLQDFTDYLRAFNSARNWAQFHAPKNVATCLLIEVCELTELLFPLTREDTIALGCTPEGRENPLFTQVKEELADCFRNVVLLHDRLGLTPADSSWLVKPYAAPQDAARDLLTHARKLAEPFVWATPEDSYKVLEHTTNGPKVRTHLEGAFKAVHWLAHMMDLNILEIAYANEQKVLAKYPVNKAKDSAAKYTEHQQS